MATDWTARTEALKYFEKQLKWAKQCNDDNVEWIEQAVNALRRSQDHTAIQTRLTESVKALRLCDERLRRTLGAAIHAGSSEHEAIQNALRGAGTRTASHE